MSSKLRAERTRVVNDYVYLRHNDLSHRAALAFLADNLDVTNYLTLRLAGLCHRVARRRTKQRESDF
jgi:hypothetical protein